MSTNQPQKRTPQDLCLLCTTRLATKKNSHIFPKFWLKNMLITEESQREAWQISTAPRSLDKVGQKVQDSPKQDYLLCPECEERMAVVERYTANHFYNRYRDPAHAQAFPATQNQRPEFDFFTATQVEPVPFKLFMYSLVWRASISTHPVFSNFKLPAAEEEGLREILDRFMQVNEATTLAYCQQHAAAFPHLPMNIITTDTASKATANFIQPFLLADNQVVLFANEFIVVFYPDWQAPRKGQATNNFADSPLTVVTMTIDAWQHYQQQLVQFFVKTTIENLGKSAPVLTKSTGDFDIKRLGL